MKLRINDIDVTQLATTITTSGSEKECARTLSANIVQSPTDSNIPAVPMNAGDMIAFEADGQSFSGIITSVQRSTASSTITITAKDCGIYVKRNKIVQKIKNMTAEAAAEAFLTANGMNVGTLVPTGYTFSRYFMNVTLYEAVMTGYALAAAQNGNAYMLRVDGDAVSVIEKGAYIAAVIRGGENLMDASYSESGENITNQVAIYDASGKLKQTVTGDTTMGVMREIIIESSSRAESIAAANEMIRKNALKRNATVTNVGNAECISGNAVFVYEPFTGLYGKFYVASDVHTWKNGLYTNKLTLAWEATMDAKAAGEAISKGNNKKKTQSEPWDYLYGSNMKQGK